MAESRAKKRQKLELADGAANTAAHDATVTQQGTSVKTDTVNKHTSEGAAGDAI